jgi:hypothetical protein
MKWAVDTDQRLSSGQTQIRGFDRDQYQSKEMLFGLGFQPLEVA